MTTSESTASETGSSDLTPELLYKFLVSMRSSIQTARTSIIRRHARLIVKLKAMVKKATDKDDQKSLSASALKNKRKAIKLKNEVKTLKNLTENDIGKLVLLNTKNFNTATKEGASAGASAICRMAEHAALVEQRLRFTSHFGQSVSQLPFCVKVLGAEKRSRRLRKLKADKKGRMLEYERRLCKLLAEIGGEEFAAAERLYVKVLSMKKSLEKRKKTEKAWAKAQGPLGDRKAAYEEYLKTVQEGEEKETFASYVQKMDAIEGNTESAAESDDDNDASMENQDASEDEDADPKQLELRKKIFENLDAKFGEWNDDDSDMSDIDDVEVTPKQIEPRSVNNKPASSRKQSAEVTSQKKEMPSPKASRSTNKTKATKKRKRDADHSDTEGACDTSNNRLKLNRSLEDHEAGNDRKPSHIGPEATSGIRDAQGPADTARADDKIRPSLFTLFKKTGLATKASAPRVLEKPKRPEPLDKNVKKSLYCDEEESSPSTTSASSAAASFFQGNKQKNVTALNKLFVGSKKKIVSENEDELAEIPESIAYEKVQKINRAGLAAENGASDDEQEDMAGFNSDFLLKHEGQSLLQHMSLRGGKRSRVRGSDTRGGGRGYSRGGFTGKSGDDFRGKSGDDFRGKSGHDFTGKSEHDFRGKSEHDFTEKSGHDTGRYPGDDEGFGGRKFGVAPSSHWRGEGGRRGGVSKRASAPRSANTRFDDDESLHPSWAAKRLNSGAIAEFKGKRTVFD